MCKLNLTLNHLQGLIYHKTQPTNLIAEQAYGHFCDLMETSAFIGISSLILKKINRLLHMKFRIFYQNLQALVLFVFVFSQINIAFSMR